MNKYQRAGNVNEETDQETIISRTRESNTALLVYA